MTENRFELQVENNIDQLPVIGDFVADSLSHFGADPATVSRVQLVIDEAATNVISYAYPDRKGLVKLVLELHDGDLIITLIDWGVPFDPNTIPPPDLNADVDNRKIGGLGIYFMKKLMDEVAYCFDPVDGNHLVMKKHLSKPQ